MGEHLPSSLHRIPWQYPILLCIRLPFSKGTKPAPKHQNNPPFPLKPRWPFFLAWSPFGSSLWSALDRMRSKSKYLPQPMEQTAICQAPWPENVETQPELVGNLLSIPQQPITHNQNQPTSQPTHQPTNPTQPTQPTQPTHQRTNNTHTIYIDQLMARN